MKKLKNILLINNEEGNEDNNLEKIDEGDFIIINEEKDIGRNLLINRNNNYKCLSFKILFNIF